jgi:hypothetical protein
MDQRLIRHRTKPEQAGANARLVRGRLRRAAPHRSRGRELRDVPRDDQVTFLHLVQVRTELSPLLAIRAFGQFQAGLAGRVDQGPGTGNLTEVGSYRFFAG